ncbi:MAG: MBL fold metallo-hydrolase [Chloroflexota bacterium]
MENAATLRYQLVVNGLDGPLLKQFGCGCPRCLDPSRQANTSVSLVGLDETDATALHILFDVGQGVVDSLVANPLLRGERARLDQICLSHWHPDHTADLNRLLVSFHHTRRRTDDTTTRPQLWCREGSAMWLQREYSFEMALTDLQISQENLPPGRILDRIAVGAPHLTITPVTVSHFSADQLPAGEDIQYACAVFVIASKTRKCVLLWDIDNQNEWLLHPGKQERKSVELLSDADILFVDTSYWKDKASRASHPSFEQVCEIARALAPAETVLVHLSGHPDGPGKPAFGWTNERWQREAQRRWQIDGLPGKVTVPHIGQIFSL